MPSPLAGAVKRGMDLALTIPGLIAILPVLAAVALVVRICMGGPVLFHQQRLGRGCVPFRVHKFRTMTDGTGPDGKLLPDSERLTTLGRFLRRFSLDELPQLWNVITGEVSLVGPRPLPLHYLPYFSEREHLRFSVRPGITGWAQTNGRNTSQWDDRLNKDVWYVENWSLWLDLRILFRTAFIVLQATDVLVDPAATMLSLDAERRHLKPPTKAST